MDGKSKPKFDKKKWREKKYDHKSQVQQKNATKKIILKSKLHRQLRRDQAEKGSPSLSQLLFQEDNTRKLRKNSELAPRFSRVHQAKLEFKKKQEEKQRLKEERQKKTEEIAKALEAYKKKKQAKFRLLSNKTKTGQPVMKGRMQMLFEQVKKSVGVSN